MDAINVLRNEVDGQDIACLAVTPYVYHCHHFNLFHDQTVEDALGEEAGANLKIEAARDAAYHLLRNLAESTGATLPAERLELAGSLFPWMGQGRLEILADQKGGGARGEYLHYSYGWREKYGDRIKRLAPIDAFAAGFSAAAIEVAYDLPPGSITANETDCYAMRASACKFDIEESGVLSKTGAVDKPVFEEHVKAPEEGLDEARISEIAAGLKQFVGGVAGDDRGLVQAFSVYVTLHLPAYYNRTSFDALHRLEKTAPQSLPAAEALFGESGHVCAFNTFGNILLSPEWEGLVGPLSGEIEDTVSFSCAIARGLGFGHWTIAELEPEKRLVMRASSNYEAPFYLSRYGRSERPRCIFFANAARAIMQLAHKVDWKSRPVLDDELYQSLFRSGESWHIEQTECLTRGDDLCEVVVSAA